MSALPKLDNVTQLSVVRSRSMKPFVQTPLDVITNPNLKPITKLIYQLLQHYNSPERGCYPGRKRLATDLDISDDTVDRSIDSLCASGLIIKTRQGRGHNNRYYFPDESASVPNQDTHESAPMRSQDEHESAPMRVVESASVRSPESAPMRSPIRTITKELEPKKSISSAPPKTKHDPITHPVGPAQEIVSAWCRATGVTQPVNFGKAMGNAAQLSKAGIMASDIPDILAWLERDKFWSGKGRDLGVVLSQADRWRSSKKRDTNRNEELVF